MTKRKIQAEAYQSPCRCRECQKTTPPPFPVFTVCEHCRNKRCPHAENHIYECHGSNEPDQIAVTARDGAVTKMQRLERDLADLRESKDSVIAICAERVEKLNADLADIRKRHGDNLKFIDTLVADKAVNQSAKQELAKVFGDLTITELAQKAIEAKGFLDQELTDWAATDTYCRAKAAEVLPEFEVYGDKDGVPPIEAIVDKLVECVSPKRKEDRAGVAVTRGED